MKTKYTWEEKDVEPGLLVVADHGDHVNATLSRLYIISYGLGDLRAIGKYSLTSLIDGAIVAYAKSKKDFVDKLNEREHHRPATHREKVDLLIEKALEDRSGWIG